MFLETFKMHFEVTGRAAMQKHHLFLFPFSSTLISWIDFLDQQGEEIDIKERLLDNTIFLCV